MSSSDMSLDGRPATIAGDRPLATPPSRDAIVIRQRSLNVHILGGMISAAAAIALVRGHLGAETTTGRIVSDLIWSVVLAGAIAMWVALLRRPGSITVTPDTITFAHKDAVNVVTLRKTGALYVRQGYRRPPVLAVEGADDSIALTTFDLKEVVRACVAMGWSFRQ